MSRTSQIKVSVIPKFIAIGMAVASFAAIVEFLLRIDSSDPQALLPLLIRANGVTIVIVAHISVIELTFFAKFRKMVFAQIVVRRAALYTLVVVFWLSIMNGLWGLIHDNFTFSKGIRIYIFDVMFLMNLITIFTGLLIAAGVIQVNKLHRKGELFEFITGKYHKPREVNRIFCFIDLKDSTSIAEQLGHYQFSLFLQDYYSDITDAILSSNAEVYQYVGDEIVLTWPLEVGVRNNNAMMCYFRMKQDIEGLKEHYTNKYNTYPRFRAGIHGGNVTVTWVGEVKKEIVFVGDVLNTAARIQEACKRLKKDYLISEQLLTKFSTSDDINQSFEEEMIPRGKKKSIRICSLEFIRSTILP